MLSPASTQHVRAEEAAVSHHSCYGRLGRELVEQLLDGIRGYVRKELQDTVCAEAWEDVVVRLQGPAMDEGREVVQPERHALEKVRRWQLWLRVDVVCVSCAENVQQGRLTQRCTTHLADLDSSRTTLGLVLFCPSALPLFDVECEVWCAAWRRSLSVCNVVLVLQLRGFKVSGR